MFDTGFEFSHTKSSKITGTFQAAAIYGSLLDVMTVGCGRERGRGGDSSR